MGGAQPSLAAELLDDEKDSERIILLHFTDTHAQLETHAEYLPGASQEIEMMGGYCRP